MDKNLKNSEKLIDFKDLDFNTIESVWDLFYKLIWEEHRFLTIFIVSSALFLIWSFFYLTFLFLFIISIYCIIFYERAVSLKFVNFAKKNNLGYRTSISLGEVKGRVFKSGHSRKIKNVIEGTFDGEKARFFHYEYSVGAGKNQQNFKFTVLEIFFDKIDFPYTLLRAKRFKSVFLESVLNLMHQKKDKNERKIILEDEFNDKFDLYITKGYGIEAMQIFNLDFLRFLVKLKADFDIELINNRLYIYDDILVTKKEDLKDLFNVAGSIIDKLSPLLKRLKNDFEALHPYFKK